MPGNQPLKSISDLILQNKNNAIIYKQSNTNPLKFNLHSGIIDICL